MVVKILGRKENIVWRRVKKISRARMLAKKKKKNTYNHDKFIPTKH